MDIYYVKLSSVGNPDFGEDSRKSVSPTEFHRCRSFAECSKECKRYISMWDLGGGNWNGGQIFNSCVQVARVSFNGRIWKGTKWGEQEIVV